MNNPKHLYFSAIRKLLIAMDAVGKTTIEVTLLDEPDSSTIQEFTNQLGTDHVYTMIHRGMVRIRKK